MLPYPGLLCLSLLNVLSFSLQGMSIINAEIQSLFGFIYSFVWCMARPIQRYALRSPYPTKGDSLHVQPRHKPSWLWLNNLVLLPPARSAHRVTCSFRVGSDQWWQQIPQLQERRLEQETSFQRLPFVFGKWHRTGLAQHLTGRAPGRRWGFAQWGLWEVDCFISKEQVDTVIVSQVRAKIREEFWFCLSCLHIYLGLSLCTGLSLQFSPEYMEHSCLNSWHKQTAEYTESSRECN